MEPGRRGVVIAGPTASGKSALALDLARDRDGVIVNSDALQVYADLDVLTARPDAATLSARPHRLFGHVDGAVAMSAAAWAAAARDEIGRIRAGGLTPIVVGGTGLYLSALFQGLSDVPPIPEAIRAQVRARAARIGAAALHAELAARDPALAGRLNPSDAQRIARALEVLEATGRSLATFQGTRAPLVDPAGFDFIALDPPRDTLNARIDARAEAMLDGGAVEEVRRLLARGLDPALPVMKAIGVPEIAGLLRGETDRAGAAEALAAATRRYAKRQRTWLRGPGRALFSPAVAKSAGTAPHGP